MHPRDLPIPSPCAADWSAMTPTERGRFCAACSLEVLDISAMPEHEARAVMPRADARVCVSYIVRPDGTLRLAPPSSGAPDVPLRALSRRRASIVAIAAMFVAACEPGCAAERTAGTPCPADTRVAGETPMHPRDAGTPDAAPTKAP